MDRRKQTLILIPDARRQEQETRLDTEGKEQMDRLDIAARRQQ